MRRRLTAEEQAAWAQLARSVRAMRPRVKSAAPLPVSLPEPAIPPFPTPVALTSLPVQAPVRAAVRQPVAVLDGGWEKQISRGRIVPDMAIDLHGHTLASAHSRLNQALAIARADGVRVLLVVTGKPRDRAEQGEKRRGAIRAEIHHWLTQGHHADAIASIRNAHPRHGGEGALYLILRRKKS